MIACLIVGVVLIALGVTLLIDEYRPRRRPMAERPPEPPAPIDEDELVLRSMRP